MSKIIIIHEEGKLHDLPLNLVATKISRICGDYIAGDAALVKTEGENLIGLTDNETEFLTSWLNLLGGEKQS